MKIFRTLFRMVTFAAAGYGGYAAYVFLTYGKRKKALPPSSLDRFIPDPEAAEHHSIAIHAPAAITWEAARNYDVTHSRLAHFLFDTRSLAMGHKPLHMDLPATTFVDQMTQAGWAILDEKPGEEIIFGVGAQPWIADGTFRTIPPEQFVEFNEPDWVKIVLNLRVDSSGVLHTETRVVTTSAEARRKFRKYWAFVLPGVKLIRLELLHGVKCAAEAAVQKAVA